MLYVHILSFVSFEISNHKIEISEHLLGRELSWSLVGTLSCWIDGYHHSELAENQGSHLIQN